MADERRPGLLCIATYEKGQAFLREAARLGCPATLLTTEKLRHADWPWEALAGFHVMPDRLSAAEVLPYITRLFRHTPYARIVPLDEFDLETAALAREHLRLPGMGQTATRYFRDKLAMREGAQRAGIAVPAFSSVADHHALWQFMERTGSGAAGSEGAGSEGAWLLKPRMSASAIGIQRIDRQEQVWPLLEQLGDAASDHLLESFVPGEIYHVDAISWQGEVLFRVAHKYGKPPMQTMHEGGVFTTRTLEREGDEARGLDGIHARTLKALGMVSGVTHSEFIRAHADGQFYFLETAARVGGAFIAEVIEYACGLNPWAEWARIEVAQMPENQRRGEAYTLPATLRQDYAGSVICLARQQQPDLSSYDAAEVVYRMQKHHHAGLIVQSKTADRVEALLEAYGRRFLDDFCARLEPPAKPTA